MTNRDFGKTTRPVINLRGFILSHEKSYMKPARVSLNKKKRNIKISKMNDFEFKTMLEKYNKEGKATCHRNASKHYFQTHNKSINPVATPKIHVSRSTKGFIRGEMTQDEKIVKMLRVADHIKVNMRSSDNLLNRLRLEQDVTMKKMDRALEAVSQGVKEVKDCLLYSTKRLRELIDKKKVGTINKLPKKKFKKKLILTTDSIEDTQVSIKLKGEILRRLKQENFEFSQQFIPLKIQKEKIIKYKVKEKKRVTKLKSEINSVSRISDVSLYIESIKPSANRLLKYTSGTGSTHSIKTDNTTTLKTIDPIYYSSASTRHQKKLNMYP